MILEKWARKIPNTGVFTDPDSGLSIPFVGKVYGHPDHPDGTEVTIDGMKRFDFRENAFRDRSDRIVRIRTPDPDYANVFPEPKKRLQKAVLDRKFFV